MGLALSLVTIQSAFATAETFNGFLDQCNSAGDFRCSTQLDPIKRKDCCLREALRNPAYAPDPNSAGLVDKLSPEALKNFTTALDNCKNSGAAECKDSSGAPLPVGTERDNCCLRLTLADPRSNPFAYDAKKLADLDNGQNACDNPIAQTGELGLQVGPICEAAKDHKKAEAANQALAVAWAIPAITCAYQCASAEATSPGVCQKLSLGAGAVDLLTTITIQKEMQALQGGLAALTATASGMALNSASTATLGMGTLGSYLAPTVQNGASILANAESFKAGQTIQGIGKDGEVLKANADGSIPNGEALTENGAKNMNASDESITKQRQNERNAACGAAILATAKIVANAAGASSNHSKRNELLAEADKLMIKTEEEYQANGAQGQILGRLASNGTGSGAGRAFTNTVNGAGGSSGGSLPGAFPGCTDPTASCAIAADPALAPFFSDPNALKDFEKRAGADLDSLIKAAQDKNMSSGDILGAFAGGNADTVKSALDGAQDRIAADDSAKVQLARSTPSSTYASGGGGGGGKSGGESGGFGRGIANFLGKVADAVSGGSNEGANFKGQSYEDIFNNRGLSLFTRVESRMKAAANKDQIKKLPWASTFNRTVSEE